jgi:sulfur carrier protein ThiS
MFNIVVGSNTSRRNVMVSGEQTVKEILRSEGIDFSTSVVYIDGATASPGDINKTVDKLGLADGSTIISVTKPDCA